MPKFIYQGKWSAIKIKIDENGVSYALYKWNVMKLKWSKYRNGYINEFGLYQDALQECNNIDTEMDQLVRNINISPKLLEIDRSEFGIKAIDDFE